MAFSLYDATVGTFNQVLTSITGVLAKGREHFDGNDEELARIVNDRLIEDMLPFSFQVVSVAHHSINALRGVEAGHFGPPSRSEEDYAALEKLVAEAAAGVGEFTPERVNAFEGKPVEFRMGDRVRMPFKAEDFLMTFSLPNFYFHATTTYDLLRRNGVQLGKGDFLGRMRLNM